MPGPPRFVLPDRSAVEAAAGENHSYALYNYYGRGPIAVAKRHRFQLALNLARGLNATAVIDMGAADGLFLPTLAKYYDRVMAIDISPEFVNRSQRLVNALGLKNVQLTCSQDLSIEELCERVGDEYDLMFLLETLEHVGKQPNVWESKMAFLEDCFALMREEGRIIISVPKMVGPAILVKNVLQRSLGLGYDRLSFGELLRSAFLYDTDSLEDRWDGHHVGFNHLKLDTHLDDNFAVQHRSESLISVFYVIGRKTATDR